MARVPKQANRGNLFSGVSLSVKAREEAQAGASGMFLLSFRDLDREQGQTLGEWEKEGMLARAMDTLRNYCCSTLASQCNTDKFTIYGGFPPREKNDYAFPKHIPDDAHWARIHITGKQCVIGHVVHNVFYIVFLDKDHRFYISELKHT